MYFSGNNIQNHISQARLALLGLLAGKNRRPLSITRKEEHHWFVLAYGGLLRLLRLPIPECVVCFVQGVWKWKEEKYKTLDHKTIFSWVLFNNTEAEVYYNLFRRASKPDRVATRISVPESGGGSVEEYYRARDSSARERNAVLKLIAVSRILLSVVKSACFF